MPQKTVEFNLTISSPQDLQKAVRLAPILDISTIVIQDPHDRVLFDGFPEPLIIEEVSIYRKTVLRGETRRIQASLKQVRRSNHIVLVEPEDAKQATWAVLEPMVDGLFISHGASGKETGLNVSTLLRKHEKVIEIDLSPIFFEREDKLSRILRAYRRIIQKLNPRTHQIILSSGARGPWFMRRGKALRGLSKTFGLSIEQTPYATTKYPLDILKKNTEKLSSGYQGGGIWVVTDE